MDMNITLRDVFIHGQNLVETIGPIATSFILIYIVGFFTAWRFVRKHIKNPDHNGWNGCDYPPLPAAAFAIFVGAPFFVPLYYVINLGFGIWWLWSGGREY